MGVPSFPEDPGLALPPAVMAVLVESAPAKYGDFRRPVEFPRADGASLRVFTCVPSWHGLWFASPEHPFGAPRRISCVGDG
eukprot:423750-Pyramimonas_sp.AAC.1